jgi:hypothetical protein
MSSVKVNENEEMMMRHKMSNEYTARYFCITVLRLNGFL